MHAIHQYSPVSSILNSKDTIFLVSAEYLVQLTHGYLRLHAVDGENVVLNDDTPEKPFPKCNIGQVRAVFEIKLDNIGKL